MQVGERQPWGSLAPSLCCATEPTLLVAGADLRDGTRRDAGARCRALPPGHLLPGGSNYGVTLYCAILLAVMSTHVTHDVLVYPVSPIYQKTYSSARAWTSNDLVRRRNWLVSIRHLN